MFKNVAKKVQALLIKKEEGASLVEYGMLVGLIAVVCIGAVGILGSNVNGAFNAIGSAIGTNGANIAGSGS